MDTGIDTHDPSVLGSKGLVFVGDKIIVYRRVTNTDSHPLELDLPGGGTEAKETPFETFRRELKEEFGLDISRVDITYSRRHPSTANPDAFAYFMVAELPAQAADYIVFGDEGTEYMLLSPSEYLARSDAWPIFQERTRDYMQSLMSAE